MMAVCSTLLPKDVLFLLLRFMCVIPVLRENQSILTLHWVHAELEKRFGKVKCEKNNFKHFGIMVERSPIGDVTLDQAFYLDLLKPIAIEPAKTGRRLIDSDAIPSEKTATKSLIGGMSWMSMTSPVAQAQASLLQHLGPDFKVRDLHAANTALEQLCQNYTPLKIKHGFDLSKLKLLVVSDSSLGNTGEIFTGCVLGCCMH